MSRHLAWLLTLGALALPSTALASKVDVVTGSDCHGDLACDKYSGGQPVYALSFFGTEAEPNDVTITPEPDGGHMVVSDATSPLTPGTRCTARDEHAVVCDVSGYPFSGASVNLGPGNDRLVVADGMGAAVVVDGGDGDDEIQGASGADTLTGGAGRDTLKGGPGNDTFPQGTAADTDLIDGGGGINTVDYSARKTDVRVTLGDTTASQGAPGENDTLMGIRNVYGGEGDDSLGGDDAPNQLRGGGGNDAIAAGAGNDSLVGGDGRDQIDAGAGDDYIDAHDANADTIACGAGNDEIGSLVLEGEYLDEPFWLGPDRSDRLAADCESAWLEGWTGSDSVPVPIQLHRRGNIVSLANPCRVAEVRRGCSGRIRIGKRSARRFSSKGKQISVRLDRRDRAAARKGPIRLSIVVGSYSVDVATFAASA